ncbi:AraC-type DNA-binding protein [Paenibacillus sp. 1_12]|nr:AraC-type DNA-binding protein [Paenibacillus sp. 1_12]
MYRFEFLSHLTHPQDSYVQHHQHYCCELVYYIQGSGRTCIGTNTSAYVSHSYSFITPGMIHDEWHQDTTEVLFIGFTANAAISIEKNAIYPDDTQHSMLDLLLRLKSEFTQQKQDYDEMLNLLTGELMIYLRRLWKQSQPLQQKDHLVYTRNYMDEHYRQKIQVEALAAMSGYSYDRFRHLFKEKYGIAPLQYIFRKRLAYARHMLIHGNHSVTEIAFEAGFFNDAQFCSMFKRETGRSPKQFRNHFAHVQPASTLTGISFSQEQPNGSN